MTTSYKNTTHLQILNNCLPLPPDDKHSAEVSTWGTIAVMAQNVWIKSRKKLQIILRRETGSLTFNGKSIFPLAKDISLPTRTVRLTSHCQWSLLRTQQHLAPIDLRETITHMVAQQVLPLQIGLSIICRGSLMSKCGFRNGYGYFHCNKKIPFTQGLLKEEIYCSSRGKEA